MAFHSLVLWPLSLTAYFAIHVQLGTEITGLNNGLLFPCAQFSECINV